MKSNKAIGLAAALAVGMFMAGLWHAKPVSAADYFTKFSGNIDRTSGPKTRKFIGKSAEDFEKLSKVPATCLDIKISLDANSKYKVLTSSEDIDKRFNVDCRPGTYGRLPMGEGVEYYVRSEGEKGKKIELSVYPGTRTTHIYNDIACTYDPNEKDVAILRIRGFYAVLTNTYPEVTVVQLRPVVPARDEVKACFDGK